MKKDYSVDKIENKALIKISYGSRSFMSHNAKFLSQHKIN